MSAWQSKEAFKARVRDWAHKLDVDVQTISMRAMKRKWASYTKPSGLLIFNLELLGMDQALCDYVIVHELLHSRVPNHGRLWKSMMRAHLGDYEKLEAELKRHSSRAPRPETGLDRGWPKPAPSEMQGGGQR